MAPRTLPEVVLEVRQGAGRRVTLTLHHVDFLIGSVPGCDLRVPGADLPALLCLIARYPGGVCLRKLAPVPILLLNGETAANADLADGDRLTIGTVDIECHIKELALPTAADPEPGAALDTRETEQREAIARDRAELERQRAELESHQQLWLDRREQLEQEIHGLLAARDEAQRGTESEPAPTAAPLVDETTRAELAERTEELAQARRAGAELEQRLFALQAALDARADDEQSHGAKVAALQNDLEVKQAQLTEARQALARQTNEYQADVVRLHRRQEQLAEREDQFQKKERELEERWSALRSASDELEGQLAQLDEWRASLGAEVDALAARKKEHDELAADTARRAGTLEGQQATLAALRTRLERQREELRADEKELDAERTRQEAAAAEWTQKSQELQQRRFEFDTERDRHAQERAQFAERSALMEAAVRQLRQAQEALGQEEERVRRQAEESDALARRLAEQDSLLESRLAQLAEATGRLEAERQTLRDRTLTVVEGEQARAALQEQLRRRAEDLAAREKALADQAQEHLSRHADLAERQSAFAQTEQESRQELEVQRLAQETRAEMLARQEAELANADEKYRAQAEQIAQLRRELSEERLRFQEEQRQAIDRQSQARADFEALRREAQGLLQHLPDLELRAGTSLDRVGHAREQLRHHLGEVHQYVRSCQDDLEQWRGRLRADLDKLQEQEQALRRRQDEHRLAMVGFRQQLIDWQAQIADMKRVLAHDETRLERKQAHVEEQVRAIDVTSQRLARQAEQLEEQEREVADRRQEVDRHLGDMREWYRQKLRDLAGIPLVAAAAVPEPTPAATEMADADGEPGIIPARRGILALGPVEPGDQRLGDVLRELQLVDADTLTALLAEARRQRRTLRQVLLSSGAISLYQLALIEAGNVAGLMLGPVRVVDRVRLTPYEAVYRVFDPRRGGEAVLRHLAEAALHDALRPDEYRQRFGQAILADPNVAATLEVLDVQGRPAVLQERLAGLAATDWPPLTAAPGVCHRLLTQAARGLAAAHRAGLTHGHLGDDQLLLTADGVLKLCGLGEPPWLRGQTEEDADVRADLKALGHIVSGWCSPSGVRRGAKARQLPEPFVSILYRLAADGDAAYRDAGELLADLETAAAAIPANAEAWDRLLKYVREHGNAEAVLRRSA